jgi:hypothetical protein
MKITLAKALKLKNRFASKIGEVNGNIISYNSVIEGQDRPVDVSALMFRRERLVDALITLKTDISGANTPIQSIIYLLAEVKGDLTFLRGIDTSSGVQEKSGHWGEIDKIVTKTSILDFGTIQGLIEQAEADIDANQDKLDKHNHIVEIEIDDEVVKLLRG